MREMMPKDSSSIDQTAKNAAGFTLIEVIIAAGIMIVLCVGTLTVFTHAVKINRGNNLRSQAQSVLQKEIEYYRSLKFVPVGSDAAISGQTETNMGTRPSADNTTFIVYVTIDNDPYTSGIQTTNEASCKFKEITIRAVPQATETGWLSNLRTNVTIQRVRGN